MKRIRLSIEAAVDPRGATKGEYVGVVLLDPAPSSVEMVGVPDPKTGAVFGQISGISTWISDVDQSSLARVGFPLTSDFFRSHGDELVRLGAEIDAHQPAQYELMEPGSNASLVAGTMRVVFETLRARHEQVISRLRLLRERSVLDESLRSSSVTTERASDVIAAINDAVFREARAVGPPPYLGVCDVRVTGARIVAFVPTGGSRASQRREVTSSVSVADFAARVSRAGGGDVQAEKAIALIAELTRAAATQYPESTGVAEFGLFGGAVTKIGCSKNIEAHEGNPVEMQDLSGRFTISLDEFLRKIRR